MQGLSWQVALFCPTCGNSRFSNEETSNGECTKDYVLPALTTTVASRSEASSGGTPTFFANVDEIVEEVAADIQKELNNMAA